MRDHHGGACAYLSEPFGAYRFRQCLTCAVAMRGKELREIAPNGEVDELRQQRYVAARRRQLEVAEANERRRHPAYDGARLRLRVAVVEHVALAEVSGGNQAERPSGRHPEVMHRLAAQEF